MQGRVHSIESFGSADGPGVRFIIFLQGCCMRCKYCHNIDTWEINAGDMQDVNDLLAQALRYKSYWGDTGGITVSGGEALLQAPFVAELFEKAHELGINTCLDTSLAPFTTNEPFYGAWQRIMAACDTVLADIKQIDPVKHKELTGRDNTNILQALTWLSDHNVKTWIRYVLVPGYTDDPDDLQKTASFIRGLKNIERIDVLPYHTLGRYKWQQLGVPYTLDDVRTPTAEEVDKAQALLAGIERV